MRQIIVDFNKKVEPYYLVIIMLAFFIGGFISIYKLFFSPPDLSVKIENETINYPASINNRYADVYSYIQDSIKNEEIKSKAVDVYQYLIKTKQQRSLEIKNNTNKTIKSLNIRMTNVRDLTSWAVSSSFLLEEEKEKLLKNIDFQKTSGIIYLKDAVDIPPSGDLTIYLWGEFNPYDWDDVLSISYDGGTAKIEYSKTYSGLKAILAEYFFEIMVFILVTFIFVFYLQTQKYVSSKENNSQPS